MKASFGIKKRESNRALFGKRGARWLLEIEQGWAESVMKAGNLLLNCFQSSVLLSFSNSSLTGNAQCLKKQRACILFPNINVEFLVFK